MQVRVVVELWADRLRCVRRRRRPERQPGKRCDEPARHAAEVVEVLEFEEIAEFASLLDPHVLMLVVVVFARLDEAHRGEAVVLERELVAAALDAVRACDQIDVKAGDVPFDGRLREPRQFCAGRVVFACDPGRV